MLRLDHADQDQNRTPEDSIQDHPRYRPSCSTCRIRRRFYEILAIIAERASTIFLDARTPACHGQGRAIHIGIVARFLNRVDIAYS
jgi:hypothetical protein